MAIKMYLDGSGQEQWVVRISLCSTANPKIRVRKSAIAKTRTEALKIESRLKNLAHLELRNRESESIKWGKLLDQWELAAKEGTPFIQEKSPATIDDYIGILRKYTQDLLAVPVDEIGPKQVWPIMTKIEHETSQSRHKKFKAAMNCVYGWAILAGSVRTGIACPVIGYKSVGRVENKRPEILTESEVRRLLEGAHKLQSVWSPIWSMAVLTGMRSGELYALRWCNVDLDKRALYVKENWTSKTGFGPTKNRDWRTVPINDELSGLLLKLKPITEPSGFVLPHLQGWKDGRQAVELRRFCIGLGIPSVRFHALRACFATMLMGRKVAPVQVMQICGWKDLKTMQHYIRLAGIEVEGATDCLKLVPQDELANNVIRFERDKAT